MPRATRRTLLPFLILAVGIAVTVLLVRGRKPVERVSTEPPAPLVRIQVARQSTEQLRVRSRGEVQPATAATLVAEVPGKVVWVAPSFEDGGFLHAGAPLLRLDRRDYELALTRAQAEEARSNVRLMQARAEAEIAVQEWSELGDGEAPPLARRDPQVEEAEAALLAARAAREEAQLNLSRTEIRAPYAGRIRSKQTDLGQFLGVGQPVAQVYGIAAAEVRLPILDAELAFLDLPLAEAFEDGPEVELSATFAGAQRRWRGRVVRTQGQIDPATRMVGLVARVKDPYGRVAEEAEVPLPVGLFVEAEILGSEEPVFRLPREALHRREGRDHVLVVEDGRLVFRPVEVLQRTEAELLIRSGLADGERVCISPLETPVDGMAVRTVEDNGGREAGA
ncbi:MAG: efflux RND transporter periplasmic adaptor subunit [Acidobacteria bacterium]|nr:efflux RND transporter periplasmic adaptor subunit [Acidobacteriota bacterium]